jgi:hypothetical protein
LTRCPVAADGGEAGPSVFGCGRTMTAPAIAPPLDCDEKAHAQASADNAVLAAA